MPKNKKRAVEKAVWKLSPQLWNADLESSAIFLTFAHQIILTHMSYPICFVSLGPGDPELITLKGLKKLRQADIIYCPATISKSGQLLSRAARITIYIRQIQREPHRSGTNRRNTSFHCSGCFSRLAYCQAGRTNHRHTRNADGGRIVEKDQDR